MDESSVGNNDPPVPQNPSVGHKTSSTKTYATNCMPVNAHLEGDSDDEFNSAEPRF